MVQYRVSDMTCGGCAARITRAIQTVDAIARVEVDRAQRLVRVEPAAAQARDIEQAIREAGYTPTVAC